MPVHWWKQKAHSATGAGLGPDLAMQAFDDSGGDRQAQTSTPTGAGVVRPAKALERLGAEALIESRTLIDDLDQSANSRPAESVPYR